MSTSRVALAAAVAGLMASAVNAQTKAPTEQELRAAGAKQLTSAEIRATHVGNTIYHMDTRTGGVSPIYFRDERRRTVVTFGGSRRDTLWWTENDRRCDESVSRQGIVCGRIYRLQGQLRGCLEGDAACFWILREIPGNPEKL